MKYEHREPASPVKRNNPARGGGVWRCAVLLKNLITPVGQFGNRASEFGSENLHARSLEVCQTKQKQISPPFMISCPKSQKPFFTFSKKTFFFFLRFWTRYHEWWRNFFWVVWQTTNERACKISRPNSDALLPNWTIQILKFQTPPVPNFWFYRGRRLSVKRTRSSNLPTFGLVRQCFPLTNFKVKLAGFLTWLVIFLHKKITNSGEN